MSNVKEEMLSKKVWAVSGVTDKEDRFGYKIWKTLIKHGYETYGVNPRYDEIEGEKIYKSIQEIPKQIEVLDMVVGPKIAINTLDDAKEAGVEYIWFQPGTFDEEVINKAVELGFKILYDDCVYKELKSRE